MDNFHPDHLLLAAVIDRHHSENGNVPDTEDRIAGVDSFALVGASGFRARKLIEQRGIPADHKELEMLLAAFWRDGFAVGVRTHAAQERNAVSFIDSLTMAELSLRDCITIRADDGELVTGKVIELALLGDDMHDVRVTLELDNKTVLSFDRAPDHTIWYA